MPKGFSFFLPAICAALVCAGAQAAQAPILLWPGGAPGSEGRTAPEKVRLTPLGEHIISGVNFPSVTPYLPEKDKANGAAVIVIPGGGHVELWMDHEGYRVGQWLSDHGVAAFVLKYRLAKEKGSPYTVEGDSLRDVQRALRLVRARAEEWNIAPGRVGVIGFSAGGELAALAGTQYDAGNAAAPDAIDRQSSRPAFMALMYPGLPTDMKLSKETPPTFLFCGEDDDPRISLGVPKLYLAIKQAGGSAEMHVLTATGHGFGIRDGNPPAVAAWPTAFYLWLEARGFLKPQ